MILDSQFLIAAARYWYRSIKARLRTLTVVVMWWRMKSLYKVENSSDRTPMWMFTFRIWFAVNVIRLARRNLHSDAGFMRAVRLGSVLGIAGVAAHSLLDFGLHLMGNSVVFLTLIMMVTFQRRDTLDEYETT